MRQDKQTTQVPDGWQLVPKEPTPEMLEEICCAMDRTDWLVHARQAWEAVLSSAPRKDTP